ncbi:MAG: hypothetical protein BMS9Abin15_1225 [Gammaproteobacteria bacterium]|nr:MAG: hypothetical protein BMS9Abin15_1225 [Gammaproteobacteria bacterium]
MAAVTIVGCARQEIRPPGQTAEQIADLKRTTSETAEAIRMWLEIKQAAAAKPGPRFPPGPPRDLWDEARRGFSFAWQDHPFIEYEIRYLLRNPEFLKRVSERATPYLYYIMQELKTRGLPMELALLPIIESAYRPEATSRSQAAGLWQIIPSTGRLLGLEQNGLLDERRDIIASTRAALDYLSDLNTRYNGDWLLTLAAYNYGWGNVNRVIEKSGFDEDEADFWLLSLPPETMRYVPRLIATSQLFAQPEKYGITITPIPIRPYFTTVTLNRRIKTASAAKAAGMTHAEFKGLNPGYRQHQTLANHPNRVLIPVDRKARWNNAFSRKTRYADTGPGRYRIHPGDTLGTIATRHGTTVRTLMYTNGLSSTNIRAGDALILPELKNTQYTANTQTAHATSQQQTSRLRHHRVSTGDTLWNISRRYQLNVRQLAAWNGIGNDYVINVGQILKLYPPGKQERPRRGIPGQAAL